MSDRTHRHLPFIRSSPPRLTSLGEDLAAIEASGRFSNYGRVERRFCESSLSIFFGGRGACTTVANATLGLMLAVRRALFRSRASPAERRRYALLPSFTFQATVHAALWNGLTPLFVDIDERTWLPSAGAETRLLDRYGDRIAIVIPYATFGNCLDLDHYVRLSRAYGVPVVVDAAASLGCLDRTGVQFGSGCPFPIVYSMHATKAFSTGEGGLVYCADLAVIDDIRAMANFGNDADRNVVLPGLNAKMTEVAALLALKKLETYERVIDARARLEAAYRRRLGDYILQAPCGTRTVHSFFPVVVPGLTPERRASVQARIKEEFGIETAHYFSPHAAEQPFFRESGMAADLPVTGRIADGILSLPLYETMDDGDVERVAAALRRCLAARLDLGAADRVLAV